MDTKYVTEGMNDPSYVLRVPKRLQLEARSHMHDVTTFRAWLAAFLRPASIHGGTPMSIQVHTILRDAVDVIAAFQNTDEISWFCLGHP